MEVTLQTLTGDIRQTLRVYSWARAQHRLRSLGYPVSFTGAAVLIAAETGIAGTRAAAALAGGFSSRETQVALAAWNGLAIKQKHGAPVLVADMQAHFEPGPGGGVQPISPGEALARACAREVAGGERGAASGRAEFSMRMRGAL